MLPLRLTRGRTEWLHLREQRGPESTSSVTSKNQKLKIPVKNKDVLKTGLGLMSLCQERSVCLDNWARQQVRVTQRANCFRYQCIHLFAVSLVFHPV